MSHRLKEKVCIHVPKVYDWVTRQVDLPLMTFNGDDMQDLSFASNGSSINDICEFIGENNADDVTIRCFITDSYGNRVDPLKEHSLLCQEIIQPGGRQQVTASLPNGDTVTLEKVKVLVKGFVVVQISDNTGTLATSCPIQFATAQTFLLCAPPGTNLDCHISFFECDADLICSEDFQQVDISITFCLEVQMEAKVKLEVEGRFCAPRDELEDVTLCPTNKFPPQCPEIFPG